MFFKEFVCASVGREQKLSFCVTGGEKGEENHSFLFSNPVKSIKTLLSSKA